MWQDIWGQSKITTDSAIGHDNDDFTLTPAIYNDDFTLTPAISTLAISDPCNF